MAATQKDFIVKAGIEAPGDSRFGNNLSVSNNLVVTQNATTNNLTVLTLLGANVVNASSVTTNNAVVANGSITRLTSNTANVNNLQSANAVFEKVVANNSTVTTETVTTLTANDATIAKLTANNATVANAAILVVSANVATVNVATITTANVANLKSANASFTKSDTIDANVANTLTVRDLVVTGNTQLQLERGSTLRSYREYVHANTVTGTYTLDLLDANIFNLVIGANTALSVNNLPVSGIAASFTVVCRRSAAGARLSWPANTVWSEGIAPTQSLGANQTDVFTFMTVNGGAMILGAHAFANVS